jgi:Ca2+-binding RTX toxin-like protein
MTGRALTLALAALSLLPAAAHAGTASIDGTVLRFTAAPGEANQLELEYSPDQDVYIVRDTGVPAKAGPGCSGGGSDVRCPAAGLTAAEADLGDRDDASSTTPPFPLPLTVHGGPGKDDLDGPGSLYGDAGADQLNAGDGGGFVLDGGPGGDDIFGRGGNDTLVGGDGDDHLTDSGGTDLLIGGPGLDRIETGDSLDTVDCQGRDDDAVKPATKATLKDCPGTPAVTVAAKHMSVKQFLAKGLAMTITCDHACAVGYDLRPTKALLPYFHRAGSTLAHRAVALDREGFYKAAAGPQHLQATIKGSATRKGLGHLHRFTVTLVVTAFSRAGAGAKRTIAVQVG